MFCVPCAEREDRYDLLHSRLLPLHHKGARGAGQGPVEQHGEWLLGVNGAREVKVHAAKRAEAARQQIATRLFAERKYDLEERMWSFGEKMLGFCIFRLKKQKSTYG